MRFQISDGARLTWPQRPRVWPDWQTRDLASGVALESPLYAVVSHACGNLVAVRRPSLMDTVDDTTRFCALKWYRMNNFARGSAAFRIERVS